MLSADIENTGKLFKKLKAITTTGNQRRKYLHKAGQMVIKTARERVKAQRTLSGSPFAPAKGHKRKGKLLRRLMRAQSGKGLKVWAGPNKAMIGWQSARKGRIARMNQEGFVQKYRQKEQSDD